VQAGALSAVRSTASIIVTIRTPGRHRDAVETPSPPLPAAVTRVEQPSARSWLPAVNRWHEKDLSITADDEGILTIRVGSAHFFKKYCADGIQVA